MTASELRRLIESGESLEVEFKSDRGPMGDSQLVEAIVCLANYQGGMLLLGVEDDGRTTGLHGPHLDIAPEHLSAMVAARSQPPLAVTTELVDGEAIKVAVFRVPAADQITACSDGKTVIRFLEGRARPACRPLYPYEFPSWYADRGQRDVTADALSDLDWTSLDPLEFERLRRLVREYRGDSVLLGLGNEELALALGLARERDGHLTPTRAGLLLVGREEALHESVPNHQVGFQVLRGLDISVNEFYRWPLLRVFERLMESFAVRTEEQELTVGLFRVPVPAYDRRSLREAINNALTHRDYLRLGAVHVQIHDERVMITNPGGFVRGVHPGNLLSVGPRPRNPVLADVFKRIGLVERSGRGVQVILTGQLRSGHLPPDYSTSDEEHVTVVLPGGPSDLQFVSLVVDEERRREKPLALAELQILAEVWHEREVTAESAASLLQRDVQVARHVLEQLVDRGLLEARRKNKSRGYFLSAAIYQQLGQPAAFVRREGFAPIQLEQMILQYVQAHGKIARREAMELGRIGEDQAEYRLRRLVAKGKLEKEGNTGRGVYYHLPAESVARNSENPERTPNKAQIGESLNPDRTPKELPTKSKSENHHTLME